MRVLLVDNQEIYLNGLSALLQKELDAEVRTLLFRADEGTSAEDDDVDVLMLGLCEAEIDRLLLLAERLGAEKAIAILSEGCAGHMRRIVSAGFDSYVHRACDAETLMRAIRTTLGGHRFVEESIGSWLLTTRQDVWDCYGLTSRERDVAVAVAEGRSVEEIAARLYITPRTVKFHLGNLYRKTGAKTRSQLKELGCATRG
jgi:two-component system response regulator DesR